MRYPRGLYYIVLAALNEAADHSIPTQKLLSNRSIHIRLAVIVARRTLVSCSVICLRSSRPSKHSPYSDEVQILQEPYLSIPGVSA